MIARKQIMMKSMSIINLSLFASRGLFHTLKKSKLKKTNKIKQNKIKASALVCLILAVAAMHTHLTRLYCLGLDSRSIISNMSDSVSSGYPNTEKIVQNTMHNGVFLTKFEVFG